MQKLKLKVLEIGVKEVLTREELKKVMGGFASGSGDARCGYCQGSSGTGCVDNGWGECECPGSPSTLCVLDA